MRQVISKPLHLPEIDLDVEVTIRLQFWVLPDGSVGRVIPLARGDVRLERAAIQYLKSWRFTPLSSGNQPVWGLFRLLMNYDESRLTTLVNLSHRAEELKAVRTMVSS